MGTGAPVSINEEDEQIIRDMVRQAIHRLNNGDITAFADYWDEGADYVSVDGRLIKGRAQIQEFFGKMSSSRTGQPQQTAAIDQIRFITPELATVDGSWTITGVRDAQGKKLDPINGKGFEVVQKRHGRWRFVATREMVIFRGD